MSIIKADKQFETGAPPDPKLMEAIEKLTAEMMAAGVVLDIGGLLPSALGAKVHAKGGKLSVKDGPFTEAKELIGGYAVLQVKSKEEAIELGKKFMQAHIDALGANYEGELEVRQMFDPTDGLCTSHPKG
jgi:hypothetical protein